MISWALASSSLAGEWREPHPYLAPVVNLSVIAVDGGETAAQASVGATGGMRVRYSEFPNWVSHTRALGVGTYGLNTGSLGGDFRLGSFLGPDLGPVLLQVGPDVWYQGYGVVGARDYHLPWSPGLDLRSLVSVKVLPQLSLQGEVTPGWVFVSERRSDEVAPFDQLTLAAMASLRTSVARLTVGYSRQYTSVGPVEGLILSGGF